MKDLSDLLPPGIRCRSMDGINGLKVHMLEAGEAGQQPCVLLVHGFPELAFSWRRIMLTLAGAGFYVVAPDQRGYGRTQGHAQGYDVDLMPWGFENLVADAVALITMLGYREVACVVGHDFGSPLAGWCAMTRPDLFQSVALMSAPFAGVPAALSTPSGRAPTRVGSNFNDALAGLSPARKHYHQYYASREAAPEMADPPQGMQAFLRGYFHAKSAHWKGNTPHTLGAMTAEALALLPTYYVMNLHESMPQTVIPYMPDDDGSAWLAHDELAFYAAEYTRTGFQGGLNWYRARLAGVDAGASARYAGKPISVPGMFIAGAQDWGIYQTPGAFERMPGAFADWRGATLVENAGHWVQQEQAAAVGRALQKFLADTRQGSR
ncbi:MAG: alpha/beta hydrolase [Proteobacteria bacterium]|nr:alpha/beta hydrolase [Pseudomonadota bacterium]